MSDGGGATLLRTVAMGHALNVVRTAHALHAVRTIL